MQTVSKRLKFAKLSWAFVFAGVLSACSGPAVRDYQAEKPKLELDQFLNGELEAFGIVQNRSGEVVKRFRCHMAAKWEMVNQVLQGTIDETFYYSDGTTSKRIWVLNKTADNKYKGTAGDVIGEATGETSGNAFNWKYVLDVPLDSGTIHLTMDDWMYLINDKVIINKTQMKKFGFKVGEVTLTIIKK
jgi:hypothetical protein